jgi:hypothetical protein
MRVEAGGVGLRRLLLVFTTTRRLLKDDVFQSPGV